MNRLVVAQITVKDHQLMVGWKPCKEWKSGKGDRLFARNQKSENVKNLQRVIL